MTEVMVMVPPPSLLALVVSLSAWVGGMNDAGPRPREVVRRMIVREEVILHIPIAQRRLPPLEWVERKGPKCLPAASIAGAAMSGPSTIDFVLRDRRRVRARLDSDCEGLDFYGGFYLEPRKGAVCAKREEIRSRAGMTCRIDRFRRLAPKVSR